MSQVLRWGIAAAGKISHDFCVAVETLNANEHQLAAVAARALPRAQEFAEKFDIPKAFGSYAELATCTDVDIVYIGALNPQHFELGMLMLEHGKHVLCEKPLCMNLKQAKKLVDYAKQKNLFLMEAIWSRFFPAYQYLRKQIQSDKLGAIQEVHVTFGFPLTEIERLQKKDLGGGCTLDLGIYTIQLCQWVFQEPPIKVEAQGQVNDEGVDIAVKAVLHYAAGQKGSFELSAQEQLPNQAIIKGAKGQITLIDFWCPTKLIDIDGQEKTWDLPKARYATNFVNSVGLRYEADAARHSILAAQCENEHVTHNESMIIAQVEDEIRNQLEVKFEADDQ